MKLTQIVFAATIVMAIFLTIASLSNQFGEIVEEPNLQLTGSSILPLTPRMTDGFAVTGHWEGEGYANIWFESDTVEALAFDTRKIIFGKFDSACIDSCSIPESTSSKLKVEIEGDGLLTLEKLHFATPQNPIGMALCPNCKKVAQTNEPDHSLLVIILLLTISFIGSHTLKHYCKSKTAKYSLLGVFVLTFIIFAALFSITVSAPTSAIAITAKRTASIFSAIGIIALFATITIEVVKKSQEPPEWEQDIWERK